MRTARKGTGDVVAAMRKRYPGNEYSLVFEVGNATGFQCGRHADALALSLWPSRGITLSGFEFKASRSDWVKELSQPEKAESIAKYCDYWWLVVSDGDIVKPGELPEPWGLLVLKGEKLIVETPAAKLTAAEWPRGFVAAMMRSATDPVAAFDDNALRAAKEAARREERERSERDIAKLRKELQDFQKQVFDFEQLAGISIQQRWGSTVDAKEFGKAVRLILNGGTQGHIDSLENLRSQVSITASRIADDLAAMKSCAATVAQCGAGGSE